ncbi:MAG: DNA mismatch repair protein MutS [Niameybacter sp.]|uniref:MutS-related protein n=1 Tax=Niameybacter sp. TaxID=2033640 RepID=UPI002FC6146D
MEVPFKQLEEKYHKLWEVEKKKYNQIANWRMIALVAAGYMTYLIVKSPSQLLFWIGAGASFAAFIYFIYKHQKVKELMEYYSSMEEVNKRYSMRMTKEWHAFRDKGEAFAVDDHPYALDLDIVGPQSLFQKINTTHTWHGRQLLAESLLCNNFQEETIVARQKAIGELLNDLDFCQRVEGATSRRKKAIEEPKKLLSYAKEESGFLHNKAFKKLIKGLPYILVTMVGLSFLTPFGWLKTLTTMLIIATYGLVMFYIPRIGKVKELLMSMMYDLEEYVGILDVIQDKIFMTPYLKEQVDCLFNGEKNALQCLKELEHISNLAHITYQPIVAILLNGLFVWDLQVVLKTEKWRQTYGDHIEDYLKAIGEVESLISLSVLGHIEPDAHFPMVSEEGQSIEGDALGHPLIERDGRVCNDVHLKNEIFVITGSNMSGKTTFMRTLGISLVLAYSGAPVIADQFKCSKMNLATSMRIRDDLSHGISTFYAELTRIKEIIELARDKGKQCFLIDEIFRGTNSGDRIIGSMSVVKALSKYGSIGAITTHDMELCQLSEGKGVANYHFEEQYGEDVINFDYKLRKGNSTTTNAKYLMRMVGIEVIE